MMASWASLVCLVCLVCLLCLVCLTSRNKPTWSHLQLGSSHQQGRVLGMQDGKRILVDLGSGVVTHTTASSDRPLDGSGMPGSDTSNLAETSVRFSLESLASVSLNNTLHSLTA